MKKSFYLLAVITTICFFVSCSSENENLANTNKQKTEFKDSKMFQKLQAFNDSIILTRETTRGWTKKQWVTVIGADLWGAWNGGKAGAWIGAKVGTALGNPITGSAFGVCLGAVVGGSFASWKASPGYSVSINSEVYSKLTHNAYICLDNIHITLDTTKIRLLNQEVYKKIYIDTTTHKIQLPKNAMTIGEMHNILLSSLDGSVEIEPTISTSTGVSFDQEKVLVNQAIESKEFKDSYENRLKDLGQNLSNGDYVVNLFNAVFSCYQDNNDIVSIINTYESIISTSDAFTSEEKELIYGALATALYSANYWDPTLSK